MINHYYISLMINYIHLDCVALLSWDTKFDPDLAAVLYYHSGQHATRAAASHDTLLSSSLIHHTDPPLWSLSRLARNLNQSK